jgi:signal transduction histidine kinase
MVIQSGNSIELIAALLFSFSIGCMGFYLSDIRCTSIFIMIYMVISFWVPVFILATPLMIYEMIEAGRKYKEENINYIFGILCLEGFIICIAAIASFQRMPLYNLAIDIFIAIIASVLNQYSHQCVTLKQQLIITRDNSVELSIALKAKNKYLIEKQDSDIRLATLKERNRIAREIHDNVGHMLSRSIIQMGAAIAINKDETLEPVLGSVKDTLDQAMNSIRSSVHDLHDESIDLEQEVKEATKILTKFKVTYEFDMSQEIPREIKYCIITIIKEAASNIVKHCNGDEVTIILREHPAFYQILVQDNGHCNAHTSKHGGNTFVENQHGSGIGLVNMAERVEAFHGSISINTEHGFKIFIIIPKGEQENENRSN